MPATPRYTVNVERLDGVAFYSLSLTSGLITGVSAAGQIYAARFLPVGAGAEFLFHLTHFRMQWQTTSGFTAAQEMALAAYKITGYTVQHGGSAQVPLALAPTYPTSQLTAIIATTSALSGGTFVLDRQLCRSSFAELAAGASISKGFIDEQLPMIDDPHPVAVLGSQDGILVRNEVAMAAGGVGRLTVDIRGYERAA